MKREQLSKSSKCRLSLGLNNGDPSVVGTRLVKVCEVLTIIGVFRKEVNAVDAKDDEILPMPTKSSHPWTFKEKLPSTSGTALKTRGGSSANVDKSLTPRGGSAATVDKSSKEVSTWSQ